MVHFGSYAVSVPLLISAGTALCALGIAVGALSMAVKGRRRMNRLLIGKAGQSLEENVAAVLEQGQRWKQVEVHMESVVEQQRSCLSRTGLVRFNPFDDTGADLSFSLALLSDDYDGVVLTSLWGRDEVRIYAKPIRGGTSTYPLSREERQAIDLAETRRMPSMEAEGGRRRADVPRGTSK